MQETMLLGLRLLETGISGNSFRSRFGVNMMDVFQEEVEELLDLGLVEFVDLGSGRLMNDTVQSDTRLMTGSACDSTLRLTPRAWLLANQVFMRFVD